LLVSVNIREAKASGTVYIRADGSIDPADAPIQRDGETYTFTGDLNGTIIVERDYITIDGNGHQLRGTGNETGIEVHGRLGVAIQNIQFMSFNCGVWLNHSRSCAARVNDFANCSGSFWLFGSSNTTVNRNSIMGGVYSSLDGWYGIGLSSSNDIIVSENHLDGCGWSIVLSNSSDNLIHGNNASNGYAGVYLEHSSNDNVILENNLIGQSNGIWLEYSNNNTVIRNNTVADGWRGIKLWDNSDNNTICDNTIIANGAYGIRLSIRSSHATITGNRLTANNIELSQSPSNNITENEFSDCGIVQGYSSGNIIRANTFSNGGLRIEGSYRNVVENNMVNGKPLVYIEGESNLVVEGEAGQVILVNCSGMLVENLQLAYTYVGILLCRTNNTEIRNTTITGSINGIETNSHARNNTMTGNIATANSASGIHLKSSHDTSIRGNTMAHNAAGIYLLGSSNVTVVRNNVTTNGIGISLKDSANSSINENTVTGNSNGIQLRDSQHNMVCGNCITGNSHVGVVVLNPESGSANNTITRNKIAGNWGGIDDDDYSSRIYHNNLLHNTEQTCFSSPPGFWDDGYPSGGNYWSDYTGIDVCSGPFQNETGNDGIGDSPYYSRFTAPVDRYPLMAPLPWTSHDVGISDLRPSRNIVGQVRTLPINVTLVNYGNSTESFNLTVYANDIPIATSDTILLASSDHTTLTFMWNTTSLCLGNYTLTVEISPLPNDADPSDNTLTDAWVIITLPGDLDGDRDIDIFDIVRMAGGYGAEPPDPRYDPDCDLDGDGDIDLFDLVTAAGNYGKSWP